LNSRSRVASRAVASEVTGLDVDTIIRLPNLTLAESAPHAPAAGFGEQEFYPEFIDKAAVLIARLARNHPLPDGNKRAAWVALRPFTAVNRRSRIRRPRITSGDCAGRLRWSGAAVGGQEHAYPGVR
jgi:hypothetical protein